MVALGPVDADIWRHQGWRLQCGCLTAGLVSTVCGQPGVTGKIYHGEDAPDERWPWQASLLFRGQHICGASLFDAQWVISAAHCFQRCISPWPSCWGGLGEGAQDGQDRGGEGCPRLLSWALFWDGLLPPGVSVCAVAPAFASAVPSTWTAPAHHLSPVS